MSFFFSDSILKDELDFMAEKNLINPYENNQIAENTSPQKTLETEENLPSGHMQKKTDQESYGYSKPC